MVLLPVALSASVNTALQQISTTWFGQIVNRYKCLNLYSRLQSPLVTHLVLHTIDVYKIFSYLCP